MIGCKQLHFALLAAALVTASSARADHHGAASASSPCADGTVVAAPAYRTAMVNEWVPEKYETTRTTYKMESKVESYTAYRTDSVPETRTWTVMVSKMVPETKEVVTKVCVKVPVTEERTVMQAKWTCQPVTTMCRRCVDKGHWECREVPCEPSRGHRLTSLFRRKKDCCEASCCASSCDPCAPATKTVRVWVPCKVWEEVPVTTMKRVCERVPVKIMVTTCKTEWREEKKTVTVCRCVSEPQTKTCTVMTCKTVPYQATRTVCVCVPHTEKVTATRMVCRTVAKQVPISDCCETSCCSSPCARKCKTRCSGLSLRGSSCCN